MSNDEFLSASSEDDENTQMEWETNNSRKQQF